MSREDVIRALRRETRSTDSTESVVELCIWLRENDVGPRHDGLKRSEIEDRIGDELEYTVRTVLTHLADTAFVEEFVPPGPNTLVIAEWLDDGDGEVVNGEVGETAQKGLEALAEEIESDELDTGTTAAATDGSGPSLRSVVAEELALIPEKVEGYLRTATGPVDTLNDAVRAIKESDDVDVGEGYGEIVFINMPYRYRLTREAIALYNE